jgi:hypothetical protein
MGFCDWLEFQKKKFPAQKVRRGRRASRDQKAGKVLFFKSSLSADFEMFKICAFLNSLLPVSRDFLARA